MAVGRRSTKPSWILIVSTSIGRLSFLMTWLLVFPRVSSSRERREESKVKQQLQSFYDLISKVISHNSIIFCLLRVSPYIQPTLTGSQNKLHFLMEGVTKNFQTRFKATITYSLHKFVYRIYREHKLYNKQATL